MEFYDLTPNAMAYVQQTEHVEKKQGEHEFKLIGSQRRVPGLTMWCINLKTGEIKPAPIKRECQVDFKTQQPEYKTKIVVEPATLYRQALNRKSFIKRLVKEGVIIRRVPKPNDVVL